MTAMADIMGLIETRVVFEFPTWEKCKCAYLRLIETIVVFEFALGIADILLNHD